MLPSFWSLRQHTQHIVAGDAIGTKDESLKAFNRRRIYRKTIVYSSVLDSAGESWMTRRHCESLARYVTIDTESHGTTRKIKKRDGLYRERRSFFCLFGRHGVPWKEGIIDRLMGVGSLSRIIKP
jgi:hypothetical protein